MRILFLVENYYPIVSGVPVVVKYLAEGLCRKGYDVALATQKHEGMPEKDFINGIKVVRFSIWRDWKHCYKGEIPQYIDFVKQYNADINIIECSECVTTDVLLPHLDMLHGKILFHSHGLSGFDNKFFVIKDSLKHSLGSTYNWLNSQIYFNWTFKRAIKRIDAFVCLSEVDSGIEYIRKYAKRYFILDNAADDMFFSDISDGALKKYTVLKNKCYIMSCANYTVVKNQKDLIRQYFLSNSSKNHSLVCIGSQINEYYNECVDLISRLKKQYGDRDVHLLHDVKRKDIPSIMRNASLYLVTSRWEQYSISIIEAMTQGVPFISTNVGNARILPGGIVVNDVSEMYMQIDDLLTQKELYNKYAKQGKEFVLKNCRINSVVDKLECIIHSLFDM